MRSSTVMSIGWLCRLSTVILKRRVSVLRLDRMPCSPVSRSSATRVTRTRSSTPKPRLSSRPALAERQIAVADEGAVAEERDLAGKQRRAVRRHERARADRPRPTASARRALRARATTARWRSAWSGRRRRSPPRRGRARRTRRGSRRSRRRPRCIWRPRLGRAGCAARARPSSPGAGSGRATSPRWPRTLAQRVVVRRRG